MATPEIPLHYVGVDQSSAAFRLMKQMGWEEGEGLGKEKHGIKGYVQQAVDVNLDEADEKDEVKSASNSVLSNNNGCEGYSVTSRAKSPQINCTVLDEVKSIENHLTEPEIEGKVLDVPPEWWGTKFGFIAGGLLGAESLRRNSPPTGGNENPDLRTTFNNVIKKIYTNSCRTKPHLENKDRVSRTVQTGCYFRGKKTNFDDNDAEDSSNLDSPIKRRLVENSELEMGVE